MRKTLAPTLALTLLALAIAGIAWAGQTAIQSSREPVPAPPVLAPESTRPAVGDDLGASVLEELYQEPVEMQGGCCRAECASARDACSAACPDEACDIECLRAFTECTSHC